MKCAHVIGAGLAGLSAALHLARAGLRVTVHEAAPHAGGRCRSFFDPLLDRVIDNGAHLMLSGNAEVNAYVNMIGAAGEMMPAADARFDFFDAANAARWTVNLGRSHGQLGQLGLLAALMRSANRPPKVGVWTLLKDLSALKSGQGKTVAACVGVSPACDTFWHPLCLAVLNAHAGEASAMLLWRVLSDTVLKGGAFARPLFTRRGLGACLIDPALGELERLGVKVRFGARLHTLGIQGDAVGSLDFKAEAEVLGAGDVVVLAVPHFVAGELLPGLNAPSESRAILNVHYRLPQAIDVPQMIGLLHSNAQWVFVRGAMVSVTVSAADAWMEKDADEIAISLWPDVAKALGVGADIPPYRVIKERRATFAQTPEALALRPKARTGFKNLFLAGDWTATGLPATIEGAIKSGRVAAEAALKR